MSKKSPPQDHPILYRAKAQLRLSKRRPLSPPTPHAEGAEEGGGGADAAVAEAVLVRERVDDDGDCRTCDAVLEPMSRSGAVPGEKEEEEEEEGRRKRVGGGKRKAGGE